MRQKEYERFISKIEIDPKTDCWEWQGRKNKDGYGTFHILRDSKLVHRVAYEHFCGQIPEGLLVCHTCNNPCCVNPKHLKLGTDQNNMDDMVLAGRQNKQKGEDHHNAKLSKEQIVEIRELYSTGFVTQQDLADHFDVSQVHISNIVLKKRWAA